MKLSKWVAARGRGAQQELHYESRVTLRTIGRSVKDLPVSSYEAAEKLSEAIARIEARAQSEGRKRVGLVSVDEIRFPKGRPKDASRAAPASSAA